MARLFLCRSPRTAVSGRSAQWFGTSSRKAIPEGHTTSITRTAPQSADPPSLTEPPPAFVFTSSTPITRASQLLRDGPPPCPATGTQQLTDLAACRAPSGQPQPTKAAHIEARDSYVPCWRLNRAHVTYTPDTAEPINRHPLGLSQSASQTLVLMSFDDVTTRDQCFTFIHLLGSHLPPHRTTFPVSLTTTTHSPQQHTVV